MKRFKLAEIKFFGKTAARITLLHLKEIEGILVEAGVESVEDKFRNINVMGLIMHQEW